MVLGIYFILVICFSFGADTSKASTGSEENKYIYDLEKIDDTAETVDFLETAKLNLLGIADEKEGKILKKFPWGQKGGKRDEFKKALLTFLNANTKETANNETDEKEVTDISNNENAEEVLTNAGTNNGLDNKKERKEEDTYQEDEHKKKKVSFVINPKENKKINKLMNTDNKRKEKKSLADILNQLGNIDENANNENENQEENLEKNKNNENEENIIDDDRNDEEVKSDLSVYEGTGVIVDDVLTEKNDVLSGKATRTIKKERKNEREMRKQMINERKQEIKDKKKERKDRKKAEKKEMKSKEEKKELENDAPDDEKKWKKTFKKESDDSKSSDQKKEESEGNDSTEKSNLTTSTASPNSSTISVLPTTLPPDFFNEERALSGEDEALYQRVMKSISLNTSLTQYIGVKASLEPENEDVIWRPKVVNALSGFFLLYNEDMMRRLEKVTDPDAKIATFRFWLKHIIVQQMLIHNALSGTTSKEEWEKLIENLRKNTLPPSQTAEVTTT